jgi:hypothetical protein
VEKLDNSDQLTDYRRQAQASASAVGASLLKILSGESTARRFVEQTRQQISNNTVINKRNLELLLPPDHCHLFT